MKKSLIALAVLGVAGVAQAQSSVTLYGIVDVVLHKDKNEATQLTSGGLSASRLGFKGTEDLGGGLSAVFLLEGGLDVDTGTASGFKFDRESYVGLGGGFGEIRFGKNWTAYDDIAFNTNPVFDSVFAPTGIWTSLGFTGNPNNGIKYVSPEFGGVSGAFSTNLRENTNERSTAFHVKYEGGPVYAGVAYQVDKVGSAETKYTTVNGSYDLGAAKILAGYGRVAVPGTKTNELSLGADVPLGEALTFSAGVATSKPDGGETARSIGLGLSYDLSKRTTAYAGVRKDNDAATAAGGVDTRYGLGIRHSF
ncbi:porin [Hydrogenophaga sp.]|uniref:porin n=1 Tax=Hydrogenophaga sp. TaxID=1904254 RepID=UPI002728D7AE|nr:porin [Hydrogenophaga sp.]MDO8905456.1 porin [Hydrogenophaga sp.]